MSILFIWLIYILHTSFSRDFLEIELHFLVITAHSSQSWPVFDQLQLVNNFFQRPHIRTWLFSFLVSVIGSTLFGFTSGIVSVNGKAKP